LASAAGTGGQPALVVPALLQEILIAAQGTHGQEQEHYSEYHHSGLFLVPMNGRKQPSECQHGPKENEMVLVCITLL
jgi:hypothetical protein